MQFDMSALGLGARYKLINSTVTPRPIAWIVTQSPQGLVNAAPYSFFNAVGVDPPLLVHGLLHNTRTGKPKDTARNILETGEYVVNLVCEADAEAMNLSSADAPGDVSEVDYAKLATAPSVKVKPPRIATSPVSFECVRREAIEIGNQIVVIGEVVFMHVADQFVTDADKFYLDTPGMKLIGRTHGSGWYARTSDQFKLERPAYDPELAKQTGGKAKP